MTKNTQNSHAYGDITSGVWTSALGVPFPANPTDPWPAGWYELGWIDDAGITENEAVQETKKFAWQGAALIRKLRSQAEHGFQFQALEENAVTLGLARPNSATTTSGATPEVQTITITGSPTGGTFRIGVPGFGSTAALAFNATTAAVATALTNVIGAAVTVGGTAGTSYIVTLPTLLGNAAMLTFDASLLTGAGTVSATVAETTKGVVGINRTSVKPFVGRNIRQFGIDIRETVNHRFLVGQGEASVTGTRAYKANDLTVYNFSVECYPDGNGDFFVDLNDNPALAAGLFT